MKQTGEKEVKKLLPEILRKAKNDGIVGDRVKTSEIRSLFDKYYNPTEEDKKILNKRNDDKLSQVIRNIAAHQSEKIRTYNEGFTLIKPEKEAIFTLLNTDEIMSNTVNELHIISTERITFDRNRIIFGAPGTGKSYKLNEDQKKLLKDGGGFERVTFHPDYSYAHFVGTYKPVSNERGEISYEYVPGPFMRTYVAAIKSANSD